MAKRRERGSVKQRGNVWRVRVAAGIDLATVSGRLGHGGGGATAPTKAASWHSSGVVTVHFRNYVNVLNDIPVVLSAPCPSFQVICTLIQQRQVGYPEGGLARVCSIIFSVIPQFLVWTARRMDGVWFILGHCGSETSTQST